MPIIDYQRVVHSATTATYCYIYTKSYLYFPTTFCTFFAQRGYYSKSFCTFAPKKVIGDKDYGIGNFTCTRSDG